MISAAGIKDQELAIITEGAGIDHPSVARSCDLAAGPGGNGYALFRAPEPVRGAEFPDSGAIHR